MSHQSFSLISIILTNNNRDAGIPASLLLYICIIACAIWNYFHPVSGTRASVPDTGWGKISFPQSLLSVILLCTAGMSLQLFSTGILNIIDSCYPDLLRSYKELVQSSFSLNNGMLRIITVIFLAPVCEEVIYRGILLRGFQRVFHFRYGRAAAIFASAALFGLSHGNVVQLCYAFPAGILLAVITIWSSSLIPAMIMHISINCSSYYADYITRACLPVFSGNMFIFVITAGSVCSLCIVLTYKLLTGSASR